MLTRDDDFVNPALTNLFAPFTDALNITEAAYLINGSEDEVLCFLQGRALMGVRVGGSWVILKKDLLAFVRSGASPAAAPEANAASANCRCWPELCLNHSNSGSFALELY